MADAKQMPSPVLNPPASTKAEGGDREVEGGPTLVAIEKENIVNKEEEEALPALTPAEFRKYNALSEKMDMFHEHFRHSWKILYGACEANERPQRLSIRQFIQTGLQFCSQLEFHHGIEENHIFPYLGKRMPAFKHKYQLIGQHRKIHKGLDKMQDYLNECLSGTKGLSLAELKTVMDSFSKVLWEHLDDEVKELGAENMRKYWKVDEVRKIPF